VCSDEYLHSKKDTVVCGLNNTHHASSLVKEQVGSL
jgi:hypothetical protein